MKDAKVVEKPWGKEVWFADNGIENYLGKILYINKGHRLSLQKHERKHETLYLLNGKVKLTLDKKVINWEIGKTIEIEPGMVHRFEAIEESTLLEVSTWYPDDVIRLEDDYDR
jgi:quercetin dioxygenase-like cupin family protein